MPRPEPLEGRARLVETEMLGEGIAFLTMEAPWIAQSARPGQFVMVHPPCSGPGSRDPLLPRPLAVAGAQGSRINLLMALAGRGTRLLAQARPGSELTLRGPLGNGFPEPSGPSLLLLAGALGAAPLLLAHQVYQGRPGLEVDFVLGVPGRAFLPLVEKLGLLVPDIRVFTEDGCFGTQGNVCTGLASDPGQIWACGPTPMFRAILDRVSPGLPVSFSLEARMGCGYGGCMGCAVPTLHGNQRACTEGPVFDGREILWHELG